MSERTPEEALQRFADWMSPMDPAEAPSVYGLTSKHAHEVCRQLRVLRTELAAAKQRVAELEGNVPLPDAAIPVTPAHAKADAAALDKLRSLHGAPNSNFTPLDRITHIPGKDDDGEMH